MSLLEMFGVRTKEEPFLVEGTVSRFGMYSANDMRNRFAFKLADNTTVFEFSRPAGCGGSFLALIQAGDKARIKGTYDGKRHVTGSLEFTVDGFEHVIGDLRIDVYRYRTANAGA